LAMRKGKIALFASVIVGILFMAAGLLTAADTPDVVKIENQGYKKDRKGAVTFTHKKHSEDYKIACTECHHVYKDGKNLWKEGDPVKKCVECHDPKKKNGKVDKLMNAFHKDCKTCHKEVAAQGKKAPYKQCNE